MVQTIPKKYIDQITELENILPEYSLETITIAFQNNREDIIPIIIGLDDVSDLGMITVGDIIKKDSKNNTHHNLINLFYDKGADVFNDYTKQYEFSKSQQLCLAIASFNYGLSDEQIDLIRDSNISCDKMEILTRMMSEKLDVSMPLKYINKISLEELKSIETCINMGFKLDDKDLEKNRT